MSDAPIAEPGSPPKARRGLPTLGREDAPDGPFVLQAGGDWLARTVGRIEKEVDAAAESDLGMSVVIDIGAVSRIDTAGAFLLERLRRSLSEGSKTAEFDGVDDRSARLFDAVRAAMDREKPQRQEERGNRIVNLFAQLGEGTLSVRDEIVGGLNIIGGAMYGAGRRIAGKTQVRPAAIVNQLDQMGAKAVPIIVLMSFLVGGIIAQQGAFQLRRFGGELYAVNLAGILTFREIGVLLAAIMVAGRSGSAITAELGSMRMREEVDALHVIGLNPIGVLVFPRLVALTIALPLLTMIANFSGILGAMLTLRLYSGISPATFLQGLQASVDLFTIFAGIIKAPFMAIVIGLTASLEGMKVGGSAESLGRHVTASVVKSIFLVILMDGLFAIFFATVGL